MLISTTIIENGIDIPRANTLIVESSDMLGLSTLYQLKGRVGRGNTQSYCYLVTDKEQAFYDAVIIACGSKAAPKTGSDGSGYELAKNFHRLCIG